MPLCTVDLVEFVHPIYRVSGRNLVFLRDKQTVTKYDVSRGAHKVQRDPDEKLLVAVINHRTSKLNSLWKRRSGAMPSTLMLYLYR